MLAKNNPEQALAAVRPLPAEEEEGSFFKRVLAIFIPDDRCQPIDPLAQINGPTGQYHAADAAGIFKHVPPPAGSGAGGHPKSGL